MVRLLRLQFFRALFRQGIFPNSGPTVALLDTFGVYADQAGRKRALTLSVVLMCAGSLIIAATPVDATIGMWAAIILLLARMIQGISPGGEYGQYVTLIGGLVLGSLTLLVMQSAFGPAALESWGAGADPDRDFAHA